MILALLFIWILASLTLIRLKRLRAFRVTVICGLIIFASIGYGIPTQYLLRRLQTSTETTVSKWKPRNIILVLGFGAEQVKRGLIEVPIFGFSRVTKTASPYHSCKLANAQCTVLVSGGDPADFGESEAKLYAAVLSSLGVDKADLLLEDKSQNTWENARFSSQIIAATPHDQVVLVSSGTHLPRSLLYAKHFGLVSEHAVRADYVSVIHHALPQAYNFLLFDLVLHKQLGILRFNVYEAMGWNGAAIEIKLKAIY